MLFNEFKKQGKQEMPNDPLDVAKFNLDAYKTSIELQMQMMKAYADYNFRMMEVAQLQIKVETESVKLAILQDAFDDYRRTRLSAIQRTRTLQDNVERYSDALLRVNFLVRGGSIAASLISLGWRGFWFLCSRAPVTTVVQLSKIKCTASSRKGATFLRATTNSNVIDDAPTTIATALELMDWARNAQIVPKQGGASYELLSQTLLVLGDGAKEQLSAAKAELKAAQSDLREIQKTQWSKIDISSTPPKSPEK